MTREAFEFVCPAPLAARGFLLRDATAADEAGLRDLYARHRWQEFAPLGLPDTQIHDLLAMQYAIQLRQYSTNYRNPRVHILESQAGIACRLMLGEAEAALRILDILVEPAARCRGLGSLLLAGLLEQAGEAGWSVTLHVAKDNPAFRLYVRLGFRVTGDVGIALAMTWAKNQLSAQ